MHIICFLCDILFWKIVIEGVRGQSYAGDIALDDFGLDDSPCPPEGYSCVVVLIVSNQQQITWKWVY